MNTDDVLEIFTRNNPVPSSKLLTFHRTEPLELIAEYSQPQLLPPGHNTLIGKFVISNIPQKEGETPKIRVKVKLDISGTFVMESAQAIEAVEEPEVAPPADNKAQTPTSEEGTKEEATPMEQESTTPKDAQQQPNTAPATPANGDKKEETTKKKKVRRIDLSFTECTSSLTAKQLQELIEEEARMLAADKLAIETAEQKNAVESYVYDMRSKLNDVLAPYATEDVRQKFSKLLEDTESWLYGEGEDVSKSVYMKKLEELKALCEPIVKRKFEDEHRYEAIMQLRSVIQNFILTAESEDPKYDHIEKTEKQKVVDECKKVELWLNTEMAKQDKLPKHVDPVITIAEINKKKQELERFCASILNKPKPKPEPKKEEKPAEQKPEAKATPEQNNTTQKEEEKKEQPKAEPNVEMDLD
jgi:heat shock protein 4